MSSDMLHILDSRTNTKYDIPIRNNAVSAIDFQKIKAQKSEAYPAGQPSSGLRIHDPGLQNTTVVETGISFSCASSAFNKHDLTLVGTMIEDYFCFEDTAWRSCGKAILKTCCISLYGVQFRRSSKEHA